MPSSDLLWHTRMWVLQTYMQAKHPPRPHTQSPCGPRHFMQDCQWQPGNSAGQLILCQPLPILGFPKHSNLRSASRVLGTWEKREVTDRGDIPRTVMEVSVAP